jgi:hypothetical protein
MTSTERQLVKQQAQRRDERRRADGERQLRQTIAAEGRLSDRRIGRSGRIGHEPDPRFAYLTRLHD